MRWRALCLSILLLGGCSKKAAVASYSDEAVSVARTPASAPARLAPPPADGAAPAAPAASQPPAGSVPLLAYAYAYGLRLPAGRVHAMAAGHQAACVAAGAAVCQVIAEDETSHGRDVAAAHLELRATPAWLAAFRAGLEGQAKAAGGRIETASTQTEDLSRSIVDTEAMIRAKTTLRDRLEQLVAQRAGRLDDVLAVERELARVQGEIDAAQSELAVMRTRVETSDLQIDYRAIGVAAPDGAGAPLQAAADSFFSNMLLVFAALLTTASFLAPIAIVAAPVAWGVWWTNRRRKPAPKARPPAAIDP